MLFFNKYLKSNFFQFLGNNIPKITEINKIDNKIKNKNSLKLICLIFKWKEKQIFFIS